MRLAAAHDLDDMIENALETPGPATDGRNPCRTTPLTKDEIIPQDLLCFKKLLGSASHPQTIRNMVKTSSIEVSLVL
jgi:hypothetical protein